VTADDHSVALAELGVPAELRPRLAQYLDLVDSWNSRTNLTGARSAGERVDVLVADVWLAAPLIQPGTLLDVGSGNGSPGLVLAVLRADLDVTLLEPRVRRWAFLREATRALGRADIQVRRERLDAYAGAPARTVTLRAVGLPLIDVVDFIEPNGQAVVFGGDPERTSGLILEVERAVLHSRVRVFRKVSGDVSRET
jgi:16S rRNA (guanine527-N7)-methyltransferase